MKKTKLTKIIVAFIFFNIMIINTQKVTAIEELPDNGAIISSAQIVQTKTGTGPFDDNDEPGNDSSEENNIVRSFDEVTWIIENTMVLNSTEADSYSGGRIYFEATLPDYTDNKNIIWDTNAMEWMETYTLSEDKRTISGYYKMNSGKITIPGKQMLIFNVKVLGASNGSEIQPTIKLWLNGNGEESINTIIPEKVFVSAKPSIC